MIALLLAAPLLLSEQLLEKGSKCTALQAELQRGPAAEDAQRLDGLARACGFASLKEFVQLMARVTALQCERVEAEAWRTLTPEKRAALEEKARNEQDPERRAAIERNLRRFDELLAQSQARREQIKAAPAKTLDLRACGELPAQLAAEAASQPPLTEDERAAFARWQKK